MRTTCPTCDQVVEGDLVALTNHVKRCGKVPKRTRAVDALSRAQSAKPTIVNEAVHRLPVSFHLTSAIPSQNTAGHSQQWYGYHKIRKEWRQVVRYSMSSLVNANFEWSKWMFVRIIPKRGKYYDDANLVGGAKALVDGLTHNRVIVDDAPQYFKADYRQIPISEWEGNPDVRTMIMLVEAR